MNPKLQPKVSETLTNFDIEHKVLECDPDFADTSAFCVKYGFTAEQSANTILVVNKKPPNQIVACVLLADSRLDVNKKVCELMGTKRASFASGEQTVEATGMEIGGVVIFGLPSDMQIYVDSRVMEQPEIVMGGGNRTSKLVLQPSELTKLSKVQVVDGLANLMPVI